MRGKSSTSTLHCRFVSAPADSPFCQKGKLFAAQEKKKKSSEELTRELIQHPSIEYV
jgi:hypothetical protein